MNCTYAQTPWNEISADWLVVAYPDATEMSGVLSDLNGLLDGRFEKLRETDDLNGKPGDILPLYEVEQIAADRVLFVGLGKPDDLTIAGVDRALATAARHIAEKQAKSAVVVVPAIVGGAPPPADLSSIAAQTFLVAGDGQSLYQAEPSRKPFESVTVFVEGGDEREMAAAVERGVILGEALNLTRELVNRPAADVYPETFAARASEEAGRWNLECDVFDESRLRDEKMGSLLAVGQGSDRPPRMVVVRYQGAADDAPTLGLVGKGVTFDSGGLSIKNTDNMKSMKADMAGAATVLGAMTAIARLKLPVNVTGYMGLVENMVSGSSYKLGDVLTARNGVTIEVLNTDAEGRLVLADVLAYAVDSGVDRIIDLATLTGSCVVALGEDIAGSFANNDEWQQQVLAAAERAGERIWAMPMCEDFDENLKSEVADWKNVGPRWGGAITAARFLEKFVVDVPWVHLDIAGPAFADNSKPHRDGGATGCMLRTLVETAAGRV